MSSTVAPDVMLVNSDHEWNLTIPNNVTLPEKEEWVQILDKVLNIFLTINVIVIMLGMGAAIYWKEVRSLIITLLMKI